PGEGSRLMLAPLDVSGPIGGELLADHAAVLTSATLALGGTFDATARSVGLSDGGYRSELVSSPFDYAKQGILYTATDLPRPGREGTDEQLLVEMTELISASDGGALGLFSSRRGAEEAAEALRERLDVPILLQGEDVLPTLVREFAADPRACLFGTLSLWQGVDVPGPSCRLVLIDRIPFPRPDDPVKAARTEAIGRAGGNGFMAVAATHAALLLAQGTGRLIGPWTTAASWRSWTRGCAPPGTGRSWRPAFPGCGPPPTRAWCAGRCGASPSRSDRAQHADHAAQDLGLVPVDGGVSLIGRQQPELVLGALQRLDRGLALDHGRHDLTVLGHRLTAHHDPVAVADRSIDHRVADHIEQE